MILDIKSKYPYPAGALSNFSAFPFTVDGIECASMEGFLQSLKTEDPDEQRIVCGLIGITAKEYFADSPCAVRWKRTGFLHWQGKRIWRYGSAYRLLLDRAYDALFQNAEFRKALTAAGDAKLDHSIGKRFRCTTVLTRKEFIGQLNRLRKQL